MKPEEKQLLIFGLAALFRAASIAGNSINHLDDDCINAAQKFMEACAARGVLPKDLP